MGLLDDPNFWTALIAGAALLYSILRPVWKGNEKKVDDLQKKVQEIKSEIDNMSPKVDLFWNFVQTELPKIMHSPHTPELDGELEKFWESKMSADEIVVFKRNLKVLYDSEPKTIEGFIARLIILGADARLIDMGRKDLIGSD